MSFDFIIRPYQVQDVPQILNLMKALARFEHYIDGFKVTEEFLCAAHVEGTDDFNILVAVRGEEVIAYSVHYKIKFTYDLLPTYIMKELYVDAPYREYGVGKGLFLTIKKMAFEEKATRLQWLVMPSNEKAKSFYKKLGAMPDQEWEHWELSLTKI